MTTIHDTTTSRLPLGAVPAPDTPVDDVPVGDVPGRGNGPFGLADPLATAPFRRADCPGEADRLLAQGLVRRVVADVLTASDIADTRLVRARAATLLMAGPHSRPSGPWVVGFSSALWLMLGCGPDGVPPDELEVIVPPGRRRPRRAGVRGRQVAVLPAEDTDLLGVAVTTPVRTAADLARDLPEQAALPALRHLGELCDVRPDQVRRHLETMAYARGVARARAVVRAWERT